MKSLIALVILLLPLLGACAKSPVLVNRVLVQNATAQDITEVTVRHEPTKKFGSVNHILAGKTLDVGLGARGEPLLATQANLQWRDANGIHHQKTLALPYDKSLANSNQAATLIYIIYPSGQVSVYLQP